jgi:hypothetical protein
VEIRDDGSSLDERTHEDYRSEKVTLPHHFTDAQREIDALWNNLAGRSLKVIELVGVGVRSNLGVGFEAREDHLIEVEDGRAT